MEEMAILENELKELKEKLDGRDINEIGVIELRTLRHDLEALHGLNLDLQERSVTNKQNGDIDIVQLRQILNDGEKLYDDNAQVLRTVVETIKTKAALGMGKVNERRNLLNAQTEIRNMINEKNAEIESKRNRASLDFLDQNIKDVLNNDITNTEEEVKRLEQLVSDYDNKIAVLNEEIDVIRFGGKVKDLTTVEEESKALTEEDANNLKTKLVSDLNEVKENKEETKVSEPENKENSFVIPTLMDENTNEVSPANEEKEEDNNLDVIPLPPFIGDEQLQETEKNKEETKEEVKEDKIVPLPPFIDDEEVLANEDTNDVDYNNTPVSLDTPLGFVDKTFVEDPAKDANMTLRDAIEGNDKEDEEVAAEVVTPKPGLWKRVGAVLLAAAAALAAGFGIKKAIDRYNNEEETNETEVTPTPEVTPTATPEEEHTHGGGGGGGNVTPEVTPTAKPTPAPTDKPTPAPSNAPVGEIAVGETLYNRETGVEVAHDGNAYLHNSDGTTTHQQDRNLQHTTNGNSIVTAGDLQPDPTQAPNRTGQEVSEQQARQSMNAQEGANLDSAIADTDFDAFFEQEYGRGM